LSELTALTLYREGLLSVLAQLYPDEASARLLLEPLGADLARLPVPHSGGSRLTWWYDTCRAVEHGAFGFTLDGLLAAVREDYPGQPALRRFLAAREAGRVPDGRGESAAAGGAGPSVVFEPPDVTFDDIAGYRHTKEGLRRVLLPLDHTRALPPAMERFRHQLSPHGFVLHGPGGTGKALFARAIAHLIGAGVHVLSGAALPDRRADKKVRELYAAARAAAPSVIVFDAFDFFAGQSSGSRPDAGLISLLLRELEDLHPSRPRPLTIGLTTRIDAIDGSLLRRLHPVAVELPGLADRREILRHYGRCYEVELDDELIELMARATDGRSGDFVHGVMRDACLDRLSGIEITATHIGMLVGRHQAEHRAQRR
jgi:hypothetical protein